MFEDLKGKVVLITGSSGGIGEVTVQLFASNDCKVVVTGRNEENMEKIANKCHRLSPSKHKVCLFVFIYILIKQLKPLQVICDLKSSDDIENLVKTTINEFGKLDVLVNLVAHYKPMNILDSDILKNFDEHITLNVRSVLQLCRSVLPHLIETKGTIINLSTVGTFRPFKNCLSYCASKAAVDMLTKVLALEFGPKGVRVNGANLGPIDTPQFKTFNNSDEIRKSYAEKNPLRRMGTVEEVAQTIAYLASTCSSYVTGSLIPIDGGTSLT
ncbi:short-chain dehydrogenease/reductase-like protein [Leptotrombidium deliense]|uniref:Short-chain dehydrogenease/reductase-like protein n=1 Tax=Leptotrombidium deliense TaxID=299467 RepID=A0A443S4F5_9ACAR|nr:short-chain dehydrogenease/reductase-like protein [Leptotrombidium deliense]